MTSKRANGHCFQFSLLAVLCCASLAALAQENTGEGVSELEEVLVQPSPEPEPDFVLGTGVSGETLRRMPGGGGDPVRGLQAMPGMTFVDDSEAAPAVRGSRPEENYMEADFIPVGYLFHAGGVISVFNADLVESFTIYSSAYGPEYSGVTGGVFDIRLRDPKTDRWQGNFDASFLHAGVLIEGPVTDDQSLYLAGRMSYLDLFLEDQLEDEDGIEFKQFPKYSDYQGKYVWHAAADSTLRFQINGAADKQEIIVSDDSEEVDTDPIFAGRHYESTAFHEQALLWETTLPGGGLWQSALGHSSSTSEAQVGRAGDTDVELDRWLVKSHASVPLNQRHDLKVGAEVTHINADFTVGFNDPACTEFETDCLFTGAERLETVESTRINVGHLFVKDNWYVSEDFTLYPGVVLHGEDYLDKVFVEPRLSGEYRVNPNLSLSAGTGIYHQMPDFIQVNEVFGNPDLDYIRSVHAVTGVDVKLGAGWSVKSELYYKWLDKLVTGDDENRYANDGEGYAYGLETLVRKDLSERLSGWLSVSLSKAKRKHKLTGDTFVFDYDQPVNVSLVGNYRLSPKWELGAKLWVHSGTAYTPIIGAELDEEVEDLYRPQYGAINSDRFPTFQRLDLRVDRVFTRRSGKQSRAYLELLNVLDARNVSDYDYNGDYAERKEVTQLPLIIGLGFSAEF